LLFALLAMAAKKDCPEERAIEPITRLIKNHFTEPISWLKILENTAKLISESANKITEPYNILEIMIASGLHTKP